MPAMLQNVERSARSISTEAIGEGWDRQVRSATRAIEREFDLLRRKSNIFEGFDLAGERVRVVERTLNDLIESGVNPNITQMQELIPDRSEEHTTELQSRGHSVCRLLREK